MRVPRPKADPGFARSIQLTPPPSPDPELSLESTVTQVPSSPVVPGGVGGGNTRGGGCQGGSGGSRSSGQSPPLAALGAVGGGGYNRSSGQAGGWNAAVGRGSASDGNILGATNLQVGKNPGCPPPSRAP